MGRGGGEDLTPLEIRAAALGGYGAQVVAAVVDARPRIVLEVVRSCGFGLTGLVVRTSRSQQTLASWYQIFAQDGARQVLRLARMLGVLPDLAPVSPPPAASSAFGGGEEEEAREEAERRREQEEACASPAALRLWLAMARKALGMREWEVCARLLLESGVVPASRAVRAYVRAHVCACRRDGIDPFTNAHPPSSTSTSNP